ncbi:MAG: hypothetical protein K8S97_01435 [Anaerolineae bacterium]|nr:hypothetical protein [Anaerolineae bacterium]
MSPALTTHLCRALTLLLLLALCVPCTTLHAQDSGDDPPTDPRIDTVAAYFTALLARDLDAAAPIMCAADHAQFATADDLPDLLLDLWQTLTLDLAPRDITVDLDELVFSPVQAGDDWVQVNVSGALLLDLPGAEAPRAVAVSLLNTIPLWAVQENDAWRGCMQPPPDVDPILGPAEVVREFFDAAFSIDYDRAQATLCAAQRDALSQTEFEMIYMQVAADGITLDFTATIFTVTAWNADRVEITLSGDIQLVFTDRPGGAMLAVSNMGIAPVPLIYEEGWKICQIATEQVEP